jgi:class 3 adenylate cyclase
MGHEQGIVTFLFTDVVRSTHLLEALGDDAADRVRRRHVDRIREVIARRGGREVKDLGDGLMVAFSSAVEAAGCAVDIQLATRELNRAGDGPALEVRMGLNIGEPIKHGADYFGTAVVVAKRLCDEAEGSQVLASGLTREVIGSRGGFRFEDRGPTLLKGFSDPIRAYEIRWDPHPHGRPPTRRTTVPLPTKTSSAPAVRRSRRRALSLLLLGMLSAGAVVFGFALFGSSAFSLPNAETAGFSGAGGALRLIEWRRVGAQNPDLGGRGAQQILRVIDDGSQMVGVGSERKRDVDAAIWVTEEGRWRRVPHSEAIFGGRGGQTISSVAHHAGRFVAVGSSGAHGDPDAAVWYSRDGRSWERLDLAERVGAGPGRQAMLRVTWSPFGWIAVGNDGVAAESDAAVWTSSTGRHWERVRLPDDSAFGGEGSQGMRAVASTDDSVVAVGFDTGVDGDPFKEAAIWLSSDGAEWTRVTHDTAELTGPGAGFMNAISPVGRGYVAAGVRTGRGELDAAIWASRTGFTWRLLPEPGLRGTGDQRIWGLNTIPGGLLAVGSDGFGGGDDAAVWVSWNQGSSWTRVPQEEAVFGGDLDQVMRFAAPFKGKVIGVGAEWGPDGSASDAAVWEARLVRGDA